MSGVLTILVIASCIAVGTWYHYWSTPRIKANKLVYRGQEYALGTAKAHVQIDRRGWRNHKVQAWIHVDAPDYVIACRMAGKGSSVAARANEISAVINNASRAVR